MRAALEMDVERPGAVREAVAPSLRDSDAVTFAVDADEHLHVEVETERLGALRGATNTALMLTALATRMMNP